MGQGVISEIREAAVRLAADLGCVDKQFEVVVVDEAGAMDMLREGAAQHGLHVPEPLREAISVRHGDDEDMLVFWSGSGKDFATQVAEAIEQLQDSVAEVTTEEWPSCPEHRHALIPVPDGDLVGWFCPTSKRVLAPLGRLSELQAE